MHDRLISMDKLLTWLESSATIEQHHKRMRWYCAYIQGVPFAQMLIWSRMHRLDELL